MTLDEIIHAYVEECRAMSTIARQARIDTEAVRAQLVGAGVTIRLPGVQTPKMAEAARRRTAEMAGFSEKWPTAKDHERHVAAVYAACPWGFDIAGAKRYFAGGKS